MLKTNLAVTGYLTLTVFFFFLVPQLYDDWNNKWKLDNNEYAFKWITIHTKLHSAVAFHKYIKIYCMEDQIPIVHNNPQTKHI